MNAILRHNYEEAREQYLENLAYMNRQNDEFAEQNGGADNLPDDKRRIYEGRRLRIIRLVAYHDRAQEYIEDLQEWVAELIEKNRQLASELSNPEALIEKFFKQKYQNESLTGREYRRAMSIQRAKTDFPNFFNPENPQAYADEQSPDGPHSILPLQTVLATYKQLRTNLK